MPATAFTPYDPRLSHYIRKQQTAPIMHPKRLLVPFCLLLATANCWALEDLGRGEAWEGASSRVSMAIIGQQGDANQAVLDQTGKGHLAVSRQEGSNNQANLRQQGQEAQLEVLQQGANNQAQISQTGRASAVSLVQVGSNNQAVVSLTANGQRVGVGQYGDGGRVKVTQR